jgi:magnesium-transporting ATPase (P-type)
MHFHLRTRASTRGLKSRLATDSIVIRDDAPRRIPAADIVPGDVVVIGAGEMLPADGVFIEGTGLQVEESVLTGEAYPARKLPLLAIQPEGADLGRLDICRIRNGCGDVPPGSSRCLRMETRQGCSVQYWISESLELSTSSPHEAEWQSQLESFL